jgi:hypothetical protein
MSVATSNKGKSPLLGAPEISAPPPEAFNAPLLDFSIFTSYWNPRVNHKPFGAVVPGIAVTLGIKASPAAKSSLLPLTV